MRIRAILRFRNEDLTRKRLIAGFKTQKALAIALNVHQQTIGAWETFKNYPIDKGLVLTIERILNCTIDEIFPPEFVKAIENKTFIRLEKVIDAKQLPGYTRGEFLLPSPDVAYEMKEKIELIGQGLNQSLTLLTQREAKVLKLRFGLFELGGYEHTLDEIGNIIGVSRERVRQIEGKALRKLKHPSRNKLLRNFINI